ncbi:MAG: DUF4126 domain-containing protein [Candidatus Eremiobacteraeota bacterium]|nr:DUF4126 domain-containing protein [Candidatus Eremiobacteraeota bacterium]
MGFLQQLLLAGTLAMCSGLRALVPLLAICWAARSGLLGAKFLNPDLYPYLAKNDTVFFVIVIFTVIEVLGDKVPSASSFLDGLHLVLRPIAGVIACLAVLNHPDPIVNYIIALGFGAGITLPVQSFRASCKILSDAISYGNYNLYLSITEDVLSLGGVVLGIVSPMIALPVCIILVYFSLNAFRKWKFKVLSGEEEEELTPERMRDDAEVLEIRRLKRLKKRGK